MNCLWGYVSRMRMARANARLLAAACAAGLFCYVLTHYPWDSLSRQDLGHSALTVTPGMWAWKFMSTAWFARPVQVDREGIPRTGLATVGGELGRRCQRDMPSLHGPGDMLRELCHAMEVFQRGFAHGGEARGP